MPLRGVNGRLYTWCVVCRDEVPSRHKTLRIHLNRAHGMEFIPGCPSCFYFRSRWADVKKHCERQHQLDIDRHHGDQGVSWGLTRLDDSSARPTYSNVAQTDICSYPLKEERLTFDQLRVVGMAKFLEPPGEQKQTSRARSKSGSSRSRGAQSSAEQSSTVQSSVEPSSTAQSSAEQSSSQLPKTPRQPSTESSRKLRSASKSKAKTESHSHSRSSRPVEPGQQSKQDKQAKQHKTSSSSVASSPSTKRRKSKPTKRESAAEGRFQSASPKRVTVAVDVTAPLRRSPRVSSPYSSTPSKARVSLDFQDLSQLSTPVTPAHSLDQSDSQTPMSQSSRRSRRSLSQVVQELSSSVEQSMVTVSSLSSPGHLSIPVLDPEQEGSELAESLHSESSEHEAEPQPGTSGVTQPTVVQQQSPSSQSSPEQQTTDPLQEIPTDQTVYLLPPNVVVTQPSFDRGSQTDLHLEQDDTVLVVPKGGGRLSLQ